MNFPSRTSNPVKMREYLENNIYMVWGKHIYGAGLLGGYISCRGHGASSKNINSNPDSIILKLNKQNTPKNSNTSGTKLTNSRFKHPKVQRISNPDLRWILPVQLLQQLRASGARRCPTTLHVRSPTFGGGSLLSHSVLCSLHIAVVFLQILTVGKHSV